MAAELNQSAIQFVAASLKGLQLNQSAIQFVIGGLLPIASCNNPPPATLGGIYSHQFTAVNGTPPYTWSITAGALPPGITLNPATGVASGTPTAIGLFQFTVTATDTTPRSGSVNCSISVQQIATAIAGGRPFGIPGCQKKNNWDECLEQERQLLQRIKFPPLCAIPKEYRNWLPWDEDFGANAIPPGAVPLRKVKGIVTPFPAQGDVVVLEERAPYGYDGLLAGLFQLYTGNGFQEGSGDIIWRVQLDQHYLENMGNSLFSLGSPVSPCPLTEGQVIFSGQTLRYIVNVPNLSGLIQVGSSQIVCGLIGFYWPR